MGCGETSGVQEVLERLYKPCQVRNTSKSDLLGEIEFQNAAR
jgi:hypothetical protein